MSQTQMSFQHRQRRHSQTGPEAPHDKGFWQLTKPESRFTEIDLVLRAAEQKRLKHSEEEKQKHDATLTAIFKAARENTVPESYVGISSTGTKGKMRSTHGTSPSIMVTRPCRSDCLTGHSSDALPQFLRKLSTLLKFAAYSSRVSWKQNHC